MHILLFIRKNLYFIRRKVYKIKNFWEISIESNPDGNVNKMAEITEIKLLKLEKTLNQIKESTLLENNNIITCSE